jgi:transitional endoplasmic reticulum ATPase
MLSACYSNPLSEGGKAFMATATKVKEPTQPVAIRKPPKLAWEEQLRLKFRSSVSHMFVMTGNTRDLADNRLTLENYFCKIFTDPVNNERSRFDLIILYDLAQGIHFPKTANDNQMEEMRELFIELAGVKPAKGNAATPAGVFAKKEGSETVLPRDPAKAFDLIEKVLAGPVRKGADGEPMHCVLICDFAESLAPAGTWSSLSKEDRYCIVKLLNWAKDPVISQNANPIILIADSAMRLHDNLTSSGSRVEILEIMLPSPDERRSYIDEMEDDLKAETGKGFDFEPGFTKEQFSNLTAGLKKLNIEDIKLTSIENNFKIGPEVVKQRKREIFKSEYQSVLEVVEPEHGWEVIGGYQWMKDYVQDEVIKPMIEGDTKRCPQGMLFVGPPGTGKSIFAQALAHEAHLNMVDLNIGKLLGSLVGESEHNMLKALLAIRSLVPVLVWMDEIDQSVNRGSSGDSGVSNRIFKMLLEFMSDTSLRGKVLFVAASNRPDMMDPALKRRGRFDKIVPFLPPDVEQRVDIFPAVVTRYGYKVEKGIDYAKLAKQSNNWVGSDIEAAVVKAYQLARRANRESIKQEDIERALKVIVPASPDDVKLWSNLAIMECSDLELLPPSEREKFSRQAVEAEVKKLSKTSTTLQLEEHRKNRGDIM